MKAAATKIRRASIGSQRRNSSSSVATVAKVAHTAHKLDRSIHSRAFSSTSTLVAPGAEDESKRHSLAEHTDLKRAFWSEVRSIFQKERANNPLLVNGWVKDHNALQYVSLIFNSVLKAVRGVTRRSRIIAMWMRPDTQKVEDVKEELEDELKEEPRDMSLVTSVPELRALLEQLESLGKTDMEVCENAKRAAKDLESKLEFLRRLSAAGLKDLDVVQSMSSNMMKACSDVGKSLAFLQKMLKEVPAGIGSSFGGAHKMLESLANELENGDLDHSHINEVIGKFMVQTETNASPAATVVDLKKVSPQQLYQALRSESPEHLHHTGDQELRVDPALNHAIVTYAEMCRALSDQDLTQDQLRAHWNDLKKVSEDNAMFDEELTNELSTRVDDLDKTLGEQSFSHGYQRGSDSTLDSVIGDVLAKVDASSLEKDGLGRRSPLQETPVPQSKEMPRDSDTPVKEHALEKNIAALNYVQRVSQTSELLQLFDANNLPIGVPDWVNKCIVEGAMQSETYADTFARAQNSESYEAKSTMEQSSKMKIKGVLKERIAKSMPRMDLRHKELDEMFPPANSYEDLVAKRDLMRKSPSPSPSRSKHTDSRLDFARVQPQRLQGKDSCEGDVKRSARHRGDESHRSDESSSYKDASGGYSGSCKSQRSEPRRKTSWVSTLVRTVHGQHRVERSRVTVEAVCVARAMTQRELDLKHNYLPDYSRSKTEPEFRLPQLFGQDSPSKSCASPRRFEATCDIPAPCSARPTVVKKSNDRFVIQQGYNPPTFGPGPGQSWSARLPGGAGLSF